MCEALSAWKLFTADRKGVASFEYVLLAALMVAAIAATYNSGAVGSIENALATGIKILGVALTNAVGGG